MDSYTITITPNNDSGSSTTLTVDTSGGQVRITDVHLHAAGGLTGGEMPRVDFGFLLRAVAGPVNSPIAITPAPAPPPAPVQVEAHAAASDLDEPAADMTTPSTATPATPPDADATPIPAPEPPRTRPARRRAAAVRTAVDGAATAGQPRNGGKPAKARKKATTRSTDAAAGGKERVYRRMPEDFADVYRQASTAAAIVDHYDVPRHTAQGWIRRFKATAAPAQN